MMPDIDKVIEALECCKAYYINGDLTGHERCPYNGCNNGDGCDKLYADALELLKCSRLIHTEHALYTVYEKHNQEAVVPIPFFTETGAESPNYVICGHCKSIKAIMPKHTKQKYCHECGFPVLWEGR